MKKFKELIISVLSFVLKFWKWKIWKKYFWKNRTELMVPFIALIAWIMISLVGYVFNIYAYPFGYWQKICFGLLGASIITGAGWLTMESWAPELKTLIDPDTANFEGVTKWQKIKLAFCFFGLYVWSATQLASGY